MVSIWWLAGALLVSALSGVATAALVLLIGGLGVLTALRKRLELVEISQENLDRRLTTEVKGRASAAGVEARQVAKSVEEEARVRLSQGTAPTPQARPSVVGLVRR